MDQIQKSIKNQSQTKTVESPLQDMSKENTLESQQVMLKSEISLAPSILNESYGHSLKSLVSPQFSYSEAYENLKEINPIVATMDLEEIPGSEDEFDSDEEDLSENEYGMSNVHAEISDEYIQEMEAMIRKHAISNLGNGPTPKEMSIASSTTPAKPSLSLISKPQNSTEKSREKAKKVVKFAEELDVAPALTKPELTQTEDPVIADAPPMADMIVERPMTFKSDPPDTERKPKISKFKAAKPGRSDISPASTGIEAKRNDFPEELSFKDELRLYNQRMSEPEQQLDHKLFQDEDAESSSTGKISKFKAARRGISQDLDS
jgi:hypothetical protein